MHHFSLAPVETRWILRVDNSLPKPKEVLVTVATAMPDVVSLLGSGGVGKNLRYMLCSL